MITYEWKITNLEYYPSLDGLNQVVSKIHFILIGRYEQYGSAKVGIQKLDTDNLDPNKYVSYADLTPEVVISWLESAIGPDGIQDLKNQIETDINKAMSPKTVLADPPWGQ
jgi:hypothetical protein